jgi:hypothetical protein
MVYLPLNISRIGGTSIAENVAQVNEPEEYQHL